MQINEKSKEERIKIKYKNENIADCVHVTAHNNVDHGQVGQTYPKRTARTCNVSHNCNKVRKNERRKKSFILC